MKRLLAVFVVGILFVVGLVWFIYATLDKHSDKRAQTPAMYYTRAAVPMVAVLTEYSKAHSVSKGITHATMHYYAQVINLQTGAEEWREELYGQKRDWVFASALLGQSEAYLFYFMDGLLVLDKASGKMVADAKDLEKQNPAQKGNMPTSKEYYYDAATGNIVYRGNDALFYMLDTKTLSITEAKVDEDFIDGLKQRVAPDDMVLGYDAAGGNFIGVLGDKDIELLKLGYNYHTNSPENARRYLYKGHYSGVGKHGRGLAMDSISRINDQVFIYGAFLCGYTTNPQNKGVIKENPPTVKVNSINAYLLLHKQNITYEAPLLMSMVTPDGKVLKTITLPFAEMSSFKLFDNTHLAIAGSKGSSDKMDDVLYIDLVSGKAVGFNFRNGKKYGIEQSNRTNL